MGKKLTTEEFIKKAQEKHGDKYDYSKAKYVNSTEKVIIICKEHGEFYIQPNNFLFGQGCAKCATINKFYTQEDYLCLAVKKHNSIYDYSKVKYIDNKTKIIIICKKHGEFLQTPSGHLKNNGCIKCANENKALSQYEYIKKCLLIHGDVYDYSKVNYINFTTKVDIICAKHGTFSQNPNNHLNGKGCLKCANDFKRDSLSDFIEKANVKHNNLYNYSKVNYINFSTKVDIICAKHGIFSQVPNTHISGSGCPKCNKSIKMDTNDFIIKSRLIHGNRYDYSSSVYVDSKTNININCLEHGVFYQKPTNHLFNNGCPKCGSKYGYKENKWLDIFNIEKRYRQIKIDKYKVDGYDPETNTIYEFNGDYWHGNPNKYNPNDININNKKTFGELYQKTMEREEKLKELGYNVISIWESDFLDEKALS